MWLVLSRKSNVNPTQNKTGSRLCRSDCVFIALRQRGTITKPFLSPSLCFILPTRATLGCSMHTFPTKCIDVQLFNMYLTWMLFAVKDNSWWNSVRKCRCYNSKKKSTYQTREENHWTNWTVINVYKWICICHTSNYLYKLAYNNHVYSSRNRHCY